MQSRCHRDAVANKVWSTVRHWFEMGGVKHAVEAGSRVWTNPEIGDGATEAVVSEYAIAEPGIAFDLFNGPSNTLARIDCGVRNVVDARPGVRRTTEGENLDSIPLGNRPDGTPLNRPPVIPWGDLSKAMLDRYAIERERNRFVERRESGVKLDGVVTTHRIP